MKTGLHFGYAREPQPGVAPCLTVINKFTQQTPSDNRGTFFCHSHWVLDYSVTDHGLYRVGALSADWKPRYARTAHLYAPGTRYWEDYRTAPLPRTSLYVLFTGGEAVGLDQLSGPGGFARFEDPHMLLEDLLNAMGGFAEGSGEYDWWEGQSGLCSLIGHLFRSRRGENGSRLIGQAPGAPAVSEFVTVVNAYLRSRLAERISLKELARHCNVSLSTLTHRYRQETGDTPWAVLTRIRMDLAKGMLRRGDRLATIAERTGFSDEFHFSKVFRKHEGLSPREWRSR